MAFRELHVVEVKEILRLWANGHGYRPIAARTKTDRRTIRRYVCAAQQAGFVQDPARAVDDALIAAVVSAVLPGGSKEPGEARDHLRAHRDLVRGWVDEGCHGPKLVRLVKRHTGVSVPLRTLQRFVRDDLDLDRAARDTVRIADPEPGQVLEVDFLLLGKMASEGRRRKLHAVLCTAPRSRHQFLWPCLSQTREDLVDALEEAWAFFGGVFPVLLPDNTTAVVIGADPLASEFNVAFAEYAQARGFEIDPARVRRPKDKARVERQVRFARDDFFLGERFTSLDEARAEARRWSADEAGLRTHGRTRRRPREAFEADEKHLLKPVPTERYDPPTWSDHTVGRDHAVVVEHALYSVPHTLTEGPVRVRCDRKNVAIFRGKLLVKSHTRQPEGGTSIDAADLPPKKAALAKRDPTPLCAQAEAFGPQVGAYARRLAEGPLPWSRMRHVYALLRLAERYGGEAVDRACGTALELDVVDVVRIRRLLERGIEARPPDPPRTPPPDKPSRFERSPDDFRRTHADA